MLRLHHVRNFTLDHKDFLKYYSQVFDFVEIDSSFYNVPNIFMTKRWASLTPDNFRFTAKFTRSITHEKRLAVPESEKELHYFFDVMRPLRTKLLALLLQLPPSLTAKEGMKKLEALTYILNPDFRYAVEVRHKSWFDRTVYKMLSDNNICLAWSQLDAIQTPAELTSDFLYLRFISGAIVYRFYESYGIYIQNLYADTEISLNLDEVRALEITHLLSISEEELKDKSSKLKPVVYDKLEKCKNIINSGYAGRTKANQIARVQFSSEENGEEYREASIKESLPRDSFTDSGHVYPDLSWSTMGSSIADKETKPLLSYIQENIPLDSGDSSDLLTKVENRIRTLRENWASS